MTGWVAQQKSQKIKFFLNVLTYDFKNQCTKCNFGCSASLLRAHTGVLVGRFRVI